MNAYVALGSFAANKNAMNLLAKVANEIVVRKEVERPNKEELLGLVTDFDILIIGVKEKMDYDIFKACTRLKYLCTLSIGTDHINNAFFETDSINVVACTDANVITVAEFVFAYVVSDTKSFAECNAAFLNRTGRDGISQMPSEMSSKIIGVIGAGNIAYKFFEITQTFKYKKFCWTINPQNHTILSDKYEVVFTDLSTILKESDYILILIPYSEKTHFLISKELLSQSKATTKFVNISRMNIIDNDAFFDKINKGCFHNSLIDCFSDEISDEQLEKISGKINLSPHVAGISVESRKRMSYEVAEKLVKTISIQ